jgi:hypothetical protein
MPLAPDEKGMKYFGPGVLDFGKAVAKAPQGYVYIAGSSTGYGRTSCVSLIRANALGVGQWHRIFDLGVPVYVTGAETTENGRCIISGVARTHGNSGHIPDASAFILCVNSKGEIVWKKIFRNAGKGTISDDLIATTDGAFLLSGKTETGIGNGEQWFLYKFRPDGDSLWLNTVFQTDYFSQAFENDLTAAADGGYLISSLQQNSLRLFKITTQGQLSWTRQYSAPTNGINININVSRVHDGGYLVCLGQVFAPYLIRFDHLGNKVWEKYIPYPSDEIWRFQDMAPALVDHGYLLACEQTDPIPDAWNAGVIKIDEMGEVLWTQTYRSYGKVAEHVVQVLPTLNTIYLVGNTQTIHLYNKYKINSLLILTDHNGKLIGTQYSKQAEPTDPTPLVHLLPNPAAENLLVNWSGPESSSLRWMLLDNQGRLMRQGFEEAKQFTLFVGDLPAGPYWLQLTSDTGSSTIEQVQVHR